MQGVRSDVEAVREPGQWKRMDKDTFLSKRDCLEGPWEIRGKSDCAVPFLISWTQPWSARWQCGCC